MDNSIDQQFVEFIVKSLVSKPDAVTIERRIDERGVLLELTVDPEDLGRVIGKRGATAQSLRTLLRALGTKNDARYNLKIVDNGEPRPERSQDYSLNVPSQQVSSAPADDDGAVAAPVSDDATSDDIPVTPTVEPDEAGTRLGDTRKELAELDDLDV